MQPDKLAQKSQEALQAAQRKVTNRRIAPGIAIMCVALLS